MSVLVFVLVDEKGTVVDSRGGSGGASTKGFKIILTISCCCGDDDCFRLVS